MIDHLSIAVSDLEKSAAFYEAILGPLGYTRMVVRPTTIGFGKRFPEVWLNYRPNMTRADPDTGHHVCLRASSPEAVEAFHAAALASGGADAGAPGPRQAAMTTYVGAFILDPDGAKLEAACFPRDA
jgi:catechol 2,3-dioxygenase-like lactoylglutathione lyase family enzyme